MTRFKNLIETFIFVSAIISSIAAAVSIVSIFSTSIIFSTVLTAVFPSIILPTTISVPIIPKTRTNIKSLKLNIVDIFKTKRQIFKYFEKYFFKHCTEPIIIFLTFFLSLFPIIITTLNNLNEDFFN